MNVASEKTFKGPSGGTQEKTKQINGKKKLRMMSTDRVRNKASEKAKAYFVELWMMSTDRVRNKASEKAKAYFVDHKNCLETTKAYVYWNLSIYMDENFETVNMNC